MGRGSLCIFASEIGPLRRDATAGPRQHPCLVLQVVLNVACRMIGPSGRSASVKVSEVARFEYAPQRMCQIKGTGRYSCARAAQICSMSRRQR